MYLGLAIRSSTPSTRRSSRRSWYSFNLNRRSIYAGPILLRRKPSRKFAIALHVLGCPITESKLIRGLNLCFICSRLTTIRRLCVGGSEASGTLRGRYRQSHMVTDRLWTSAAYGHLDPAKSKMERDRSIQPARTCGCFELFWSGKRSPGRILRGLALRLGLT